MIPVLFRDGISEGLSPPTADYFLPEAAVAFFCTRAAPSLARNLAMRPISFKGTG
jgi:hypothetical protein